MESPIVVVARTDNIGDVVVSLWSLAWLHKKYPDLSLGFITRQEWQPLVARCDFINSWCALEDFLKGEVPWKEAQRQHIVFFFSRPVEVRMGRRLGFRRRTGTAGRWWHWLWSNDRVFFSRKRSQLHEAQLNLLLLYRHFPAVWPCPLEELRNCLPWRGRKNSSVKEKKIIVHPFTNRSAPLWPKNYWVTLIRLLSQQSWGIVYMTGLACNWNEADGLIREAGLPPERNLCGKFDLEGFIRFVEESEILVAPSTGPLHIAAALGVRSIGLYVPRPPMHPGRWGPLGPRAMALTGRRHCLTPHQCRPDRCGCMEALRPEKVLEALRGG
ncbi:MAG: glycosyltransferase family 9 protein [Flavobacteriales bacterium]|nr:glycosyltransferase family 9 protein [Flavobacteriales bacterium]MCX7768500.1 glycosyltransferase family 9 protein [Flavobacteriales bacterium]MDW8409833.1 glycosyltransferase family 9 protein [Flavobacteriales bacterium]